MLKRAGAQAVRGDVNDLAQLRIAAEAADGIIRAAFNHDFSQLKYHVNRIAGSSQRSARFWLARTGR